jgi:hypothetical protein
VESLKLASGGANCVVWREAFMVTRLVSSTRTFFPSSTSHRSLSSLPLDLLIFLSLVACVISQGCRFCDSSREDLYVIRLSADPERGRGRGRGWAS